MKKILTSLMLVFITVLLISCGKNNSTKVNTISSTELTDREEALLTATSDKLFVFDFNVDDKYKEVAVWVEKYKFGVKVEEATGSSRSPIQGEGLIIFSTNKITKDSVDNENIFNITLKNDNGISKASSIVTVMENEENNYGSTWGTKQSKNDPITGKMALASICYSKANTMASLSNEFYGDIDSNLDELKGYDEVYLLRCEFLN